MRFRKSFGRFWYDLVIIGDDWKIAVAVVLAIAALVVMTTTKVVGDDGLTVLGGALIVVFFAVSLLIDVRPKDR